MKRAFSIRCMIIGEDCLARVVRRALESARKYGVNNARGISLFAVLSLVLGSDFDRDPQSPWASHVLSDPSTATDPVERTNRLHQETLECLRQWWGLEVGAGA